jgi:lipopolysaccharide transport system permease protein
MILLPTWFPSLGPLVRADLRRRYAGSFLGALWAILGPVLEVAAYAVVFGWLLGPAFRPGLPYAVLIASGLLPWISFRETIEGCSSVLPDNRWIRRSGVPMELLVARVLAASSIRAIVSLVVVFGFAAAAGPGASLLGWTWPLVALVLQALGAYGLGLLVAPLTTLYPGLRPTLVSLLTLLTFASPILYPEALAQGAMKTLLLCNPFTHLLRLYRSPVEALAWQAGVTSSLVALGATLVCLAAGWAVRTRLWWRVRDLL